MDVIVMPIFNCYYQYPGFFSINFEEFVTDLFSTGNAPVCIRLIINPSETGNYSSLSYSSMCSWTPTATSNVETFYKKIIVILKRLLQNY